MEITILDDYKDEHQEFFLRFLYFSKVDLLDLYRIISVATQGRQDFDQWVNSYKLAWSTDGTTFRTVQDIPGPGADKVSFFSDYSSCFPIFYTKYKRRRLLGRIKELSIFLNIY